MNNNVGALRKCPRCGGIAEKRRLRFCGWEYWVQCTKCGMTTKSSPYEPDVVREWNEIHG